jgi:hypothetical protein
MRKTLTATICSALVLAAAAAVHFRSLDGLDGLLFGLAFTEDTVYAAGYSDSAFRSVRLGMPESEVHSLLGPPLERWAITDSPRGADRGERWSRSPGDTHYRCRVVQFGGGRVVAKHSEFYVD